MASRPTKLRLLPRTTVKGKSLTRLAARLLGGDGITVDKANGAYTIALNPATAPDVLGLVIGTDVQAQDADLQALADNVGTGLWAVTGAGTGHVRTLTGPAAGITITNGDGASGNPTLALANDLAAYEGLSLTGLVARTADGVAATRTVTAPAAGITVTNGDGVSGNPTLALANDLAAFEGLSATGLVARTADGAASARTLQSASAGLTWTNGDGVSGNPVPVFANDLGALEGLSSTGFAARTATDTWAQRTFAAATGLTWTNPAGIAGNPSIAYDIPSLTNKASPDPTNDYVIIYDAAGAATKKATVGSAGAAGSVASLNGQTGAISVSVAIQKFTSSGTYTPTTGMVYCIIECVGGGGGGGAGNGTVGQLYNGAGGGAGGYSRLLASAATIGASKTVTIGTAGAGAIAGANNGGAGGDTSVGSLCIGKGGSGGLYASSGQVPVGGAGGVAGTGDFTPVGMPGFNGVYNGNPNPLISSGNGGSSVFGGGGSSAYNTSSASTAGNAASNYGSGGSGGFSYNSATNSAGGAGSAGIVVITEYIVH